MCFIFQEQEIQRLSAEIESLKHPQNLEASQRLEELREENARLKYRLNILKRVRDRHSDTIQIKNRGTFYVEVAVVSSESSGRKSLQLSVHDQHQPAAGADLRCGHQSFLPRLGEPAAGPGAQPAGQVWRLPVQQCHGHGPGESAPDRRACAGFQDTCVFINRDVLTLCTSCL